MIVQEFDQRLQQKKKTIENKHKQCVVTLWRAVRVKSKIEQQVKGFTKIEKAIKMKCKSKDIKCKSSNHSSSNWHISGQMLTLFYLNKRQHLREMFYVE